MTETIKLEQRLVRISPEIKQLRKKEGNAAIAFSLQLRKYLSGGFFWAVSLAGYLFPIILIVIYNRTTRDLSNAGFWKQALLLIYGGYFPYYAVIVPLVLATAAFRDDFNDQNIVYLFVKPVSRKKIYLFKLLAYVVASSAMTFPPLIGIIVVAYIASAQYDAQFNESISIILLDSSLLLFGLLIIIVGYGIVFMSMSLVVKRPLLINLIIGFSAIFEAIFVDLINNEWEFPYIAINLISNWWIGFDSLNTFLLRNTFPNLSPVAGLIHAILVSVVFLAIGLYQVPRKELY